jgi:hypothetical protein
MAFSFRIPLIALSAVHLAYSATNPDSTEPQFAVTKALLCQQIMVAWSLISATVPNLKNFLKSFSIRMGFPVSLDLSMSGSSNVYALRSLRNNRSGVTSSAAVTTAVKSTSDSAARSQPHSWRPDQVSSQTTAARDSGSNSRDDISEEGRNSRAGSQEMIINKAVTWKVTYEDNQYPFDCRKPPLPYLAAGLANKNALNQRYIHPHLTLVVPKVPAIAKST